MRVRFKPRFFVIMIALTLLILAIGCISAAKNYTTGAQYLQQARIQRDELQLQVNALMEDVEFAKTDDYVIRVARDEVGMIMPGEVRYVNGAR